MKTFLLKIADLYGFIIMTAIFGTIIYVVMSDAPVSVSISSVFDFLLMPFVWFWNNIQSPLITWCLGLAPKDPSINSFVWFILLFASAGGALFMLLYFPIVLLLMPLWTLIEPIMVHAWAKLLNPLGVFNIIVLPLGVEFRNNMEMTSDNAAVRQMAINDDLADRINGKVATKQTIIGN